MGVCAWVRTLFVYYSGLKLSSQCKTLISILSRVYATFDYNAQKVFKIPNLFDHAKPNSNYVNKATPQKFEMKWTFHMAHYWYKLKQEKIVWSFVGMLSLNLKVSWIRFISHAPIMKSFCLISWIEASMQMLDMGLIRWISKKKICWYIILKECGIINASLEFQPRYFNDGPF